MAPEFLVQSLTRFADWIRYILHLYSRSLDKNRHLNKLNRQRQTKWFKIKISSRNNPYQCRDSNPRPFDLTRLTLLCHYLQLFPNPWLGPFMKPIGARWNYQQADLVLLIHFPEPSTLIKCRLTALCYGGRLNSRRVKLEIPNSEKWFIQLKETYRYLRKLFETNLLHQQGGLHLQTVQWSPKRE